MPAESSDPSLHARLCAACGMCCDGVLFHSVELQRGDSARQLSALGLKMRRKKGIEFFLQPCSAHGEGDGVCACRIYDHRPSRCRRFNCRQLLGVTSGNVSEAAAFSKIHEARSLVSRVNALIAQIGASNSGRSLAHRVANALTQPAGTERTSLHEELETAMGELEMLLEQEFRVR